jgi:CHAT domain-containing protein/tetratricopeptide (TPR) repeat protein
MAERGEFEDLLNRVPTASDPDERIRLIDTVLALTDDIKDWPLKASREKVRAVLLGMRGTAYADRTDGHRSDNIERSITSLESSVAIAAAANLSPELAASQNNLGIVYQDRIQGSRRDNIERAIAAHQAALKFFRPETDAEAWGTAQMNLGAAYMERTLGSRAENIEAAIAGYEAALTVTLREASPADWAMIQANLGLAYRNRVRGEASKNIERAIEAHTAALSVYGSEPSSASWALAQNHLGAAYLARIAGERADNLEFALAAFEAALAATQRDAAPLQWAEYCGNRAIALMRRVRGNRAENIESAIEAYQAALDVFTQWGTPSDRARTQMNLGNGYSERVRGTRAQNIELAIESYSAALLVFTREDYPDEWAHTQSGIGNAYAERIKGSRAENFEFAIRYLQSSLEVFSAEDTPGEWARGQTNLGSVYAERLHGNRADNFEAAITAFRAALTVRGRTSAPWEWATTQTNLASALGHRIRGERAENLEAAIAAYKAALSVKTREASPYEWALNLNNLGTVYLDRLNGERTENIEMAVSAFLSALSVRTREALPDEWAQTQANLGRGYANKWAAGSSSSIGPAIAAYQAALSVRTLEAMPRRHLRSARMLGELQAEAGDWASATVTLSSARSAFLMLIGQGLEDAEVQDLVTEAGTLFNLLGYLQLRTGEGMRALGTLAEGRARLMNVALKQLTLPIASHRRERFESLRADVRRASEDMHGLSAQDGARTLQRLGALRRELAELMEEIAPAMGDADALALVRPVVDVGGILVAPVVTKVGGKLLIVGGEGPEAKVTALDLPQLTTQRLDELMQGPQRQDQLGGWLAAYNKNYEMAAIERDLDQLPKDAADRRPLLSSWQKTMQEWLVAIEGLGGELWRLIGAALVPELNRLGIQREARLVWMPTSSLGLLPIGLAQDPATGRRLGETYEVCYAPSLEALRTGEQHVAAAGPPALVAIAPSNDLASTEFEARLIGSHFNASRLLGGEEATRTNVLAALRDASYWHFATHGSFDWVDARRSSLQLSQGTSLTIGTLLEVDGLKRPRLVSLSACETGLYDIRGNSDEFIGMPGTFTALGAAGVLGTLWPVDDRATALLMTRFYDLHLREGLRPATALKRAQTWLAAATATELVVYVKGAAARAQSAGITLDIGKLEASLLRGKHDDPRYAMMPRLLWAAHVAHARKGLAERFTDWISRFRRNATDSQPFAHPYYWGGFVYTGV